MHLYKAFSFMLIGMLVWSGAQASDTLLTQKVTNHVYAIIGSMENRTPDNLGNNATFGVVITSEGVILIDTGATAKGARQLHEAIKKITSKPVVVVINSGGQDHRWLGNSYFKSLGARIIASNAAIADQKARSRDQLFMLSNLVGNDGMEGTHPLYADTGFDTTLELKVGDTQIKIQHAGQAHTPGDSFIWLQQERVMFTGDIVYTERMLGVGPQSNSASWLKVFEAMAAYKPEHIIPGHGAPTDLQTAQKDTYDYLRFLRQSVRDFMDTGGDISEIRKIDQSRYLYLQNFDTLAGRNAQKVYTELEWE